MTHASPPLDSVALAALCRRWAMIGAVLLLALVPPSARTQEPATAPRNVLILYSNNDEMPWQQVLRSGLREQLAKLPPTNLFEESLDSTRLSDGGNLDAWAVFLTRKFSKTRLDAVVAEGPFAVRFLTSYPELLPNVPRALISPGDNPVKVTGTAQEIILVEEQPEESVRIALRLRPQTRHLVVVGNLNPARVERMHAL